MSEQAQPQLPDPSVEWHFDGDVLMEPGAAADLPLRRQRPFIEQPAENTTGTEPPEATPAEPGPAQTELPELAATSAAAKARLDAIYAAARAALDAKYEAFINSLGGEQR